MKKKRWLCLFTVMVMSMLLSLSVSAAPGTDRPSTDKNQYQGTVDQIYLAIHDQEGEWPAEPSIADHAYLFLKKSGNTITSGGSGSVQFDTKASNYINTKAFQDLYRGSVKTSGSDGGKVTGLSKPTGMDGTEGFWTQTGFSALTSLKNDIIRVYLQNRTSDTQIKNPTEAQIAAYDVLIYVVKYEEYYTGSGAISYGNSGYHVDCAVVKKSNVKLVYDANLPDGYTMVSGVGLPNNKTVAQNTKGVVLDNLSYRNNQSKGQEIENAAGQAGAFLGWSLDKETVVSSVDIETADVTVYALWRTEEPQENVSVHYDANLPDGFSLADGVTLPGSKTVAQNTSDVSLGALQYAEGLVSGNEIHNEESGQNGNFLGWSLTANGTDTVTSIDVGTTDVTVYAVWSIEAEEPEQPGRLSVLKTVKSVGGAAVPQDEDGNLVIPTAYPGYEILWEITVTNSGSEAASFTLTDALLEQGAKVYDADGNPVIVSGTLWTGTVAANSSCTYTVRYTLQKKDLSADGLVNTVVLDEEEIPAEAVPTSAYPVYVYFKTLLVKADGTEEAISLSTVNYNDATSGGWATLGWISDLLTEQPADAYSETSYESGFQVAKSAVSAGNLTAYGDNGTWLSSVQWDKLIASHGANGLGDTEIVTEPEGRLAWHLNGSVRVCRLTYDGNASDASGVPEEAYLVKDTASQVSDQIPYRAGYVFTGWNTKPDGTGDSYEAGSTITLSMSDTLYAQWEETTASFDLNDMGGSPVIKKQLDGNPSSSYAETFTVTLTPIEQEAMPLSEETQTEAGIKGYADISADNRTAGFVFAEDAHILTFEVAGTYFYQVQEVSGSNSCVTYDDTVYMLVITVSQTDDGVLKISDWQFLMEGKEALGAYLTITNTYTAPSGGGGGTRPPVVVKDTVKEYLNTEDHFAYIVGYSDGTVRPNSSITRAEVATIFFRLLNDDVRDKNLTRSNSFSDVNRSDWYNTAISTMAALGILDGYSDGTFRPNEPITRAEFAAIAARFDENAASGSASFSDLSGHWAAGEISKAYKNGWVTGYSDGTFRPDQSITRAEAVALINRVLERELTEDAELLDEMNVWSDNRDTGKWYYLDIQEATNSHAYTRDKKGKESWVKLRTDPDWTSYED